MNDYERYQTAIEIFRLAVKYYGWAVKPSEIHAARMQILNAIEQDIAKASQPGKGK